MLGTNGCFRFARGALAACVGLCLSFASLLPSEIEAFGAPAACCRTGGRCCRHRVRRDAPSTPAFAAHSPCEDGGRLALGTASGNGAISIAAAAVAPPSGAPARIVAASRTPRVRLSGESLRQRPPPFPLA
jgi:hypothetical protein